MNLHLIKSYFCLAGDTCLTNVCRKQDNVLCYQGIAEDDVPPTLPTDHFVPDVGVGGFGAN